MLSSRRARYSYLLWLLFFGAGKGFSPARPTMIPMCPPTSTTRVDRRPFAAVAADDDAAVDPMTDDDGRRRKPVVAVVGSGAVGCYYGVRLHETGLYDVRFLMRGEHYATSVAEGLNVASSCHGDMFVPPDVGSFYDEPADMVDDAADWVLIALKSTSIDVVPSLVRPLLGRRTRVLAIMNGMVDDDLVDLVEGTNGDGDHRPGVPSSSAPIRRTVSRCAAVYGGMAFVCVNRVAPGKIHHSYAGGLTGALAASSSEAWAVRGDQYADEKAFLDLWRPTIVDHAYENDLVRGRWSKACWNLPYNGVSVAMGGVTVDVIMNDPGLRRLADDVMDETVEICNADLRSRGVVDPSFYLGRKEKDAMVFLSDSMGPYKTSTMLDLCNRRPMEVKYIFRKPLERAKQLNVPVPKLETIVAQIEAYQRMHKL